MPGERKSVEPMAAIIAPARVSAKHQSLLHLVGQAAWSDEAVVAKARELVLPAIEAQGKIEAWIVDDTGFAKKGVHSVGVARQYCGRLGKTDNCQIAVTLSIANHASSLPIAYRLYLPEDWAVDEARRKEAGVPDDVTFQTKPEIALAQIRAALAAGVAPGVLLTDAGYGADGAFRSAVTASGLTYVVGVQSTLSVWPPGVEPLPPKPWSGRGRPPSRMRRDGGRIPVSAKTLARGLPEEAWRIVLWREGSNEILSSRFAAVRIRPASTVQDLSSCRVAGSSNGPFRGSAETAVWPRTTRTLLTPSPPSSPSPASNSPSGGSPGRRLSSHSKAAQIYRKTGNLRAVQLLLGHTKIESTVRYLGIEVDDALTLSEQVELWTLTSEG